MGAASEIQKLTVEGWTFTKKEATDFLADIAKHIVETNNGGLHSLLALNRLLSAENANEIFDEDLKSQARDIWIKIKSSGVHLCDPPLLFGYPTLEEKVVQKDTSEVLEYKDEPVEEEAPKSKKKEKTSSNN